MTISDLEDGFLKKESNTKSQKVEKEKIPSHLKSMDRFVWNPNTNSQRSKNLRSKTTTSTTTTPVISTNSTTDKERTPKFLNNGNQNLNIRWKRIKKESKSVITTSTTTIFSQVVENIPIVNSEKVNTNQTPKYLKIMERQVWNPNSNSQRSKKLIVSNISTTTTTTAQNLDLNSKDDISFSKIKFTDRNINTRWRKVKTIESRNLSTTTTTTTTFILQSPIVKIAPPTNTIIKKKKPINIINRPKITSITANITTSTSTTTTTTTTTFSKVITLRFNAFNSSNACKALESNYSINADDFYSATIIYYEGTTFLGQQGFYSNGIHCREWNGHTLSLPTLCE